MGAKSSRELISHREYKLEDVEDHNDHLRRRRGREGEAKGQYAFNRECQKGQMSRVGRSSSKIPNPKETLEDKEELKKKGKSNLKKKVDEDL